MFIARNVQPDVISKMSLAELDYWHKWHKLADDYEKQELKKIKAKKYHPDA